MAKSREQKQADIARWRAKIPKELQELPNWVLWRYHYKKSGQRTKPPYQTDGSDAKSNVPATWANFKAVLNAYETGNFDGIGFQLDNSPYLGIDLDDCINDSGELSAEAANIISMLDGHGYIEHSPSGTGLHILLRASKPRGRKRIKRDGRNFEMYDGEQYFTVTGNVHEEEGALKRYDHINAEASDVQDAVNAIFSKYWTRGQAEEENNHKREGGLSPPL